MNKHEVFAHFSDIIDNMLHYSLFFCTYFQNPYPAENIYGAIDDLAVPENIAIKFGATRGCIVDEDYDYVVKFDVEEDKYGWACEREEKIYHAAVIEGVSNYFAECVYLGTYHKVIPFYSYSEIERKMDWYDYDGESFDNTFMQIEDELGEIRDIVISIPLYAYPRASRKYHSPSIDTDEIINKAQKIISPMRDKNLAVAIDFIREYGEDEYQRVSDFMIEQDINDLHTGNFAFINNRYVCLDYSGFHSCTDTDTDY